MLHKLIVLVWLLVSPINVALGIAAEAVRPPEWNKAVEEAKKEAKIVLAIPPARIANALEPLLKQKFGLDAELISASGPKNASRIAAEKQAGVSYFDALICGTGTAAGLTHDGMLEPIESFWILPEVKDPKQWWGGHIWEDNVNTNRFLYSFLADVSTQSTWYNSTLAKPQELRTFEDYLNGSGRGASVLATCVKLTRANRSGLHVGTPRRRHLKKLVAQDLFLTRDLRQFADALAKGKVALVLA